MLTLVNKGSFKNALTKKDAYLVVKTCEYFF